MMLQRYLEASEYEPICLETLSETERENVRSIAAKTVDPWERPVRDTLSLHLEPVPAGGTAPHSHSLIGQVWLKGAADPKASQVVLRVIPKVARVDPIQMYAACLSDPIVRLHLDKCITIFWRDDPIPVGELTNHITPLIIGRYLTLLYDLCQKHLRASIQPIQENLIGRMRGRPLVQQTIRQNLAKGRADRAYCRYQLQSIDTKANQVLVAALRQAVKYLDQHGLRAGYMEASGLARLAAYSSDALQGVTVCRIKPSDFGGLQYGGFMKLYREPHRWARLVLQRVGYDPHEDLSSDKSEGKLPPFALDMNELFERYCEVLLRRGHGDGSVWAGYDANNLGSHFSVRPDFLVRGSAGWVVDAKYKRYWSWRTDKHRADVNQVVTYSRHREVREALGAPKSQELRIAILYPVESADKNVVCLQELRLDELAARYEADPEFRLLDFEDPILLRLPVVLPSKYPQTGVDSR